MRNNLAAGEKENKNDVHLDEKGHLYKGLRKNRLESMFLFVTSKCNSKCSTCFYHERLNKKDDLTFEQIKKISETSPEFDKLWLSGGEPLLRDDLADILILFHKNNKIKSINFPTNGIATDKIIKGMDKITEAIPGVDIHLNFSLDGPGALHDRIRGIPGNYKKTINTMEILHEKFRNNKKLLINAVSVVSPENYEYMYDFAVYLYRKNYIGTHFFEALRGDPKDKSFKGITGERMSELHNKLMPLYEKMGDRLFADFKGKKKNIAMLFFLGFLKFVLDIQDKNVNSPSHWGMKCVAGKTTIVVDANGDFRSCEMRQPVGNLRDYSYNISSAMNSMAMKEEISGIGGGAGANCWCTHSCWIMSSLKFSPKALVYRIPKAYFDYKKVRDPEFRLPELSPEFLKLAGSL